MCRAAKPADVLSQALSDAVAAAAKAADARALMQLKQVLRYVRHVFPILAVTLNLAFTLSVANAPSSSLSERVPHVQVAKDKLFAAPHLETTASSE